MKKIFKRMARSKKIIKKKSKSKEKTSVDLVQLKIEEATITKTKKRGGSEEDIMEEFYSTINNCQIKGKTCTIEMPIDQKDMAINILDDDDLGISYSLETAVEMIKLTLTPSKSKESSFEFVELDYLNDEILPKNELF